MGPLQRRSIGPSRATSPTAVVRRGKPRPPIRPKSRELARVLVNQKGSAQAHTRHTAARHPPVPKRATEPAPQSSRAHASVLRRMGLSAWLGLAVAVVSIGGAVIVQVE